MDVIKKIDKIMKDRGWSAYRLSKESGVSEATVGNMFRRNTVPTIPTLEAICNGFGITLSQFFAEQETVEMTDELKKLFEGWVSLTLEQKEAVRHLIEVMNKE